MDIDFVKVVIGVIVAVASWIVGHMFNSRRDAVVNRKEQMTVYLIDAYRKLNCFAGVLAINGKGTATLAENINSAVGDIQLFGTKEQIRLVKEISEHMVARKEVPDQKLVDLLLNLRDSLRAELGLEKIELPIAHFHIEYSENNNQPNQTLQRTR